MTLSYVSGWVGLVGGSVHLKINCQWYGWNGMVNWWWPVRSVAVGIKDAKWNSKKNKNKGWADDDDDCCFIYLFLTATPQFDNWKWQWRVSPTHTCQLIWNTLTGKWRMAPGPGQRITMGISRWDAMIKLRQIAILISQDFHMLLNAFWCRFKGFVFKFSIKL